MIVCGRGEAQALYTLNPGSTGGNWCNQWGSSVWAVMWWRFLQLKLLFWSFWPKICNETRPSEIITDAMQKLFEIDCRGPLRSIQMIFFFVHLVGRCQDSGGMQEGAGREMSKRKRRRETDCFEQRGRLLFEDSSIIYLFSQEILNSNNPIFAALILALPNILFLRAPLWEQPSHLSLTPISPPHSPSREITGRNRWDEARSSAEIWTYTLHKTGKVDVEIVLKAGIQLSAVCQTLRLGPRWGIFSFFYSWMETKKKNGIKCGRNCSLLLTKHFGERQTGKVQAGVSLLPSPCCCWRSAGSWLMIHGPETRAHTHKGKQVLWRINSSHFILRDPPWAVGPGEQRRTPDANVRVQYGALSHTHSPTCAHKNKTTSFVSGLHLFVW